MPNYDNTLPLDGSAPEQRAAARYLMNRAVRRAFAAVCGIAVQRPARRNGFKDAATSDKKRAGAIVIPYFNHDGTRRDFARYRLADEVRKTLGLEQKFDQDQDTGAHLYMPPLKHPKGLTMQQVFGDTSIALNIAEGETRALAANYLGEPTVAIGGINMGVVGGELLKDLQDVRMQGRIVRLLIDADVPRSERKQNIIIQLTRKLEERGADVYLMPAPGEGNEGWDDFIATHGAKAFRKQLAEAKSCKDQDFASWGTDGIDIDLALAPISREWLLEAPPALEWTCEGLLPRRTAGLLVAPGGTGKTFFVQRLMQCIAGGIPFLGHATRQGKAVHIACEDGPDELRRRQYKTFQHETAGMEPAKVKRFAAALQENLYVRSVVGQQMHLVTTDGNNVIQGRALDVLIHQLKAVGGVEIVAIDPLSRAHSCPTENDSAWGTAVINAGERIAQEVGCAVLVVHHTGKGTKREDQYGARGTSALPDAARLVLQLAIASPDECRGIANVSDEQVSSGQIIRLINAKLSYGPRLRETWLLRTEGGVLERFEPELRLAKFADDDSIRMLREWWEKNGRRPLIKEAVRKKFKEIFRGTLRRETAVKAFEDAVFNGLLVSITDAKNPRSQGFTFKNGGAQ